ncbi:MAG: type III-B CRISPR module RAMP protein Cmr6 [Candidatus Aminicenantes bacterium]|nr:type III-B CRISPR module RAMP protein Cmr6 [Candidatus Aminicenantes bacterium]
MTDQNNKPRNDLDLFTGSNQSKERHRSNPGPDHTVKKENINVFSANIGWLYYKDYYHDIPFHSVKKKEEFKPLFEVKNQAINSRQLSRYPDEVAALKLDYQTIQRFELTTEYPGLVTGLGNPHESHQEGEYKLGFYFDHTTGLPVIPGSSVKGVLRSAFKKSPDYIKYLLENPPEKETPILDIDIDQLEKEIFDGEGLSPYKRDIFLDAVIVAGGNMNQLFLAADFITPHPDEFKDPVPLQFLKVLPQVTFRFQFRLKNEGLISIEGKKSLFERILKDLGIGAKTNVGYGKFKE